MSRERLMEQQRARMEARRKQLKKEVEKAKAKKVKKAVTRDTSKDQSRKTVNRLTGGTTPKTGESAKQTLSRFSSKKPAPVVKAKPAPAAKAKPTPAPKAKPAPKPKAKPTPHRGKQRFADGGKGGKFDTSSLNNLKMSEHPGLKQNQKPKKPKMGATKTVNGQAYYYDGSKWVKGKLGNTKRFKG